MNRKGLRLATTMVLVLAFVGVVMPFAMVVLLAGTSNGIGYVIRGGRAMLVDVVLMVVGPILAGALGVRMVRGKKAPALAGLGIAALAYFVPIWGALSILTLVNGVLGGASIDPDQKGRILADGLADTLTNDVFGSLVAAGIAVVVVAACASAVATLAGPNRKTPRLVVVAGALWLGATVIVAVLRFKDARGMAFSSVVVVAVLVPYAFLAARQAGTLREWTDKAEAERAAGMLVIAGVAAVFAALAIQRAFEASMGCSALRALASPSLDPTQQMRYLAAGVAGRKLGPAAYAVHAVFGTLTFALAAWPAFAKGSDGEARSPVTDGALAAIVGGLILVGVTFILDGRRMGAVDKVAVGAELPQDVTLPHAPSLGDSEAMTAGLSAHGILVGKKDPPGAPPGKCSGASTAMVVADKDANVGALQSEVLKPTHACTTKIMLRLQRDRSPAVEQQLGDWSKLLPQTSWLVLNIAVAPPPARGRVIEVESKTPTQLKIDGTPAPFPLPDAARPTANGQLDQIDYFFDRADTVDHMLDVIASVEHNLHSAMTTSSTQRYVGVFY